MPSRRLTTNVRFQDDVRKRLEAFMAATGATISGATNIAMDRFLLSQGYPPREKAIGQDIRKTG